jgi:ABC-type bacteriocin/lantibiotic exporter with double-glycine peptidase domain
VVFGVYIASGKELTAALAFTVLSLLNLLNGPLTQLVSGWTNYINARIAIDRISHFLSAED